MAKTVEMVREGLTREVWSKYCSFLDLSLPGFMQVQRRLLLEQVSLLIKCELGSKLLGGASPRTVDEFRRTAPLTTYDDYLPYLAEKRGDVLPRPAEWWLHTSGKTGVGFKQVPFSQEAAKKLGECGLAGLILGASDGRGQFPFSEGDTLLCTVAPFPYISGALARAFEREFAFAFLPSLDRADQMMFQERIQEGFRLGLGSGIDAFFGVASVLAKMGEQFRKGAGGMKLSAFVLSPRVLFRIARALLRSRMDGRKYLLPKDLWDVKCLATGGADTSIFRGQIERDWGRPALEAYAATDALGFIAVQTWNFQGMTFFPDTNFLEFIPEEESMTSRADPSVQPETLLLDQVQPGKRYELVITNFWGGAFVRYRLGDLIEITALEDTETGVALPQMQFYSRCDDVVDLAGFTRLTEKDVWWALERANTSYVDWTARKEVLEGAPALHLYLELTQEVGAEDVKQAVDQQLRGIHGPYCDLQDILGMDPLRVTVLAPGSFARYYMKKQSEGADLAHLKPPHMAASDETIKTLLSLRA